MSGGTTVAVGYDGSADARRALSWAAATAAALGGRLRIVHAVGLLEHGGLSRPGGMVDEAAAVELACQTGLARHDVEWRAVDGDPCSALLRAAQGPDAATLLVVGSRGTGGHVGTLLGSTSLEVAEHAPVPVVIVPSARPGEQSSA